MKPLLASGETDPQKVAETLKRYLKKGIRLSPQQQDFLDEFHKKERQRRLPYGE